MQFKIQTKMGEHFVDKDNIFIRDLTVRKQGKIHGGRTKHKSSNIFRT